MGADEHELWFRPGGASFVTRSVLGFETIGFADHLIRLPLNCFSRLTLTWLRPEPSSALWAPSPIRWAKDISRSRERRIYFAIFKSFSFQDSKPPSISMTE